MKFIHCADLHLDAGMTAHLSKEQAKVRRAELLRSFVRMVEYAAEQAVEVILLAGDLFDTERVTANTKNVVMGTIAAYPGIKFFYLRGNHDLVNCLQLLEERPDNLFFFSEEDWRTYSLDEEDRITVTGLELTGENPAGAWDRLVLPREGYHIVMLHGQEARYENRDQAEVIPLNRLKDKYIDYLALGHVHFYKQEALDDRGVYCYPGCLEGRGFDETGVHGFVLLEVDPETGKGSSQFVPFATRRVYDLPVDITGAMDSLEIAARMQACISKEQIAPESLLRIRLVGSVDVELAVDIPYLLAQYEGDYFSFQIAEKYQVRVDYHQYELDETLKGEFVRLVHARLDLSEDEKGRIIQYGLRAIAGEEF